MVGRGQEQKVQATIDAYRIAAKQVAVWELGVLIITSPRHIPVAILEGGVYHRPGWQAHCLFEKIIDSRSVLYAGLTGKVLLFVRYKNCGTDLSNMTEMYAPSAIEKEKHTEPIQSKRTRAQFTTNNRHFATKASAVMM